ncbi:MAG: DUF4258 domain-containing protein [Anaerolineae bacterium]
MKQFRFIEHALKELQRRSIPMSVVMNTLEHPDQVVPNVEDRVAYQKIIEISGKRYLLRVIVENGDTVVTVYRTSKITKYWSDE